jgi:hypothetical protein
VLVCLKGTYFRVYFLEWLKLDLYSPLQLHYSPFNFSPPLTCTASQLWVLVLTVRTAYRSWTLYAATSSQWDPAVPTCSAVRRFVNKVQADYLLLVGKSRRIQDEGHSYALPLHTRFTWQAGTCGIMRPLSRVKLDSVA